MRIREQKMTDNENGVLYIIEKAIEMELLLSDLYIALSHEFEEDKDFWWQISLEEKNHAAFLKSGRDIFIPFNKFPLEVLPENASTLEQVNNRIRTFIGYVEKKCVSRKEVFDLAVELESSAGETHYQTAMMKIPDSKILEIFQLLNEGDKDHKERMLQYMDENNI